jgi:hypothetical protein
VFAFILSLSVCLTCPFYHLYSTNILSLIPGDFKYPNFEVDTFNTLSVASITAAKLFMFTAFVQLSGKKEKAVKSLHVLCSVFLTSNYDGLPMVRN